MARWVRRRDRAGRVRAIANQRRGALELFGVTRKEADRAAWTIDGAGRRLEGAAAINRVLAEVGGLWSLVARLYGVRLIAASEEVFYRWFAKRRSSFHRFGVKPECDEPGTACE
jgi:predicted DCC family thiol-disulfide oxidoreductase YuxK